MPGTLFIGDYAYSSWSLRGWLLFRRFGVAVSIRNVDFMAEDGWDAIKPHAPGRTVPLWVGEDGALAWDSLAIAEELASRHPEAGLWPDDPVLRSTARSLSAEMHSGFSALRTDCPMNLRCAYRDVPVSDAVRSDLARLEDIWSFALDQSGGPWLCGAYSIADAFYAPVAARIAGYDLPVGDVARRYTQSHLADPAFRRWRAMGLVHGSDLPWYARDYDQVTWPGPDLRAAKAVEAGKPENDACPYSGDPVTHLMEMDGRVFGFCNALCRDKTVADPEAWPDFMALVES